VVFGVFTITNGWKILDAITPEKTSISSSETTIPSNTLETEEVAWSHDGYGFSPQTLSLKK
jgi:hypothetical protein